MFFQVDKLIEGNDYFFRVCAENSIGASDWTTTDDAITARLPFDPPGPPLNCTARDVTATSCLITWDAPEEDGGSTITGYFVEKLVGSCWIKVNRKSMEERKLRVDDLVEGSENEYRVMAENAAGVGKASQTTGLFTVSILTAYF